MEELVKMSDANKGSGSDVLMREIEVKKSFDGFHLTIRPITHILTYSLCYSRILELDCSDPQGEGPGTSIAQLEIKDPTIEERKVGYSHLGCSGDCFSAGNYSRINREQAGAV